MKSMFRKWKVRLSIFSAILNNNLSVFRWRHRSITKRKRRKFLIVCSRDLNTIAIHKSHNDDSWIEIEIWSIAFHFERNAKCEICEKIIIEKRNLIDFNFSFVFTYQCCFDESRICFEKFAFFSSSKIHTKFVINVVRINI